MNFSVVSRLAVFAGATLAAFVSGRALGDALVDVLQAPPLFDRRDPRTGVTFECPNGHIRHVYEGAILPNCTACPRPTPEPKG